MSTTIECAFYGGFRPAVGERTVRLETDAETVGDLLRDLESRYPALEGRLLANEAGDAALEATVTLDRRDVRHREGLETPLADGCVCRLVPQAYGGSP